MPSLKLRAADIGRRPASGLTASGMATAIALLFAGCGSPGADSACIGAFAAAAAVSPMLDAHEDLFPAYTACTSIEEWRSAHALHSTAIEVADPVRYAMNVCASYQDELRETPICEVVNAPPAELGEITSLALGMAEPSGGSVAAIPLKPSGQAGLLGVPLPEGARLIERTPGDTANHIDPREAYKTSAGSPEISAFFAAQMPAAGWLRLGESTATALLFQKGDLMIGIFVGDGRFSLVGS
ncbi:hypothetical protein [Candidatus Palauibacter sp.]|uniref:hypothetical protein n=1 Tax=Candidatus Palauibacter sp. TaxID=3101350 RepID=UPI003B5243EF